MIYIHCKIHTKFESKGNEKLLKYFQISENNMKCRISYIN